LATIRHHNGAEHECSRLAPLTEQITVLRGGRSAPAHHAEHDEWKPPGSRRRPGSCRCRGLRRNRPRRSRLVRPDTPSCAPNKHVHPTSKLKGCARVRVRMTRGGSNHEHEAAKVEHSVPDSLYLSQKAPQPCYRAHGTKAANHVCSRCGSSCADPLVLGQGQYSAHQLIRYPVRHGEVDAQPRLSVDTPPQRGGPLRIRN